MGNNMAKHIIIILAVILLIGFITAFFPHQSNADKIKPEVEENGSGGDTNLSMMNASQNENNATGNNIMSIPLERPPFIKD